MKNISLSSIPQPRVSFLWCGLFLIFFTRTAWSGPPAKLDLVPDPSSIIEGLTAHIKVNLLDAENQPAAANKDTTIELVSRSRSGATETVTGVINAGENNGLIELPMKEAGPVRLVATAHGLASGGSILNVRPSGTAAKPSVAFQDRAEPITTLAAPGSAPPAAQRAPASLAPHFHALARAPLAAVAREKSPVDSATAALPSPPPPVAEAPDAGAAVAPAAQTWNPDLTFLYVPERKIWGDKKDAATIYAMLPPNEVAPWEMYVYMISSEGSFEPEALVIPKGQNSGKIRLTSDRPAAASVKFMSSVPWAKNVSGLPLKIAFGPTKLKMLANPPKIGLFESTEIDVRLADASDNNVVDDEKRDVSLAVDAGSGGLDQTSLTINPNTSQVTTHFRPTLPGTVRLLAESPNIGPAGTNLIVVTPILILVLCALGGVAGGWIAFFEENAKWPRIIIGLIAGFVLYWLFVFSLILIPNFPHILVFNPFSAAIIGVGGGWLGTKVFSIFLQKFGISV